MNHRRALGGFFTRQLVGPAVLSAVFLAMPTRERSGAHSDIDKLEWLTGCWSEDLGPTKTEEEWMAPTGNSMLGIERTLEGDSTVDYEFHTIADSAGRIVLKIVSSFAPPSELKSDSLTTEVAVFIEPGDGYPHSVSFGHSGGAQLVVRKEGVRGQKNHRIDFLYNRVPCASGHSTRLRRPG